MFISQNFLSKNYLNRLQKILVTAMLGLILTACQTNNEPSVQTVQETKNTQTHQGTQNNHMLGKGNSVIETMRVAPQTQKCTGMYDEQDCLVVNDEYFYDTIKGFDFEAGYEYELAVKKTQHCDPDTLNDCPQDVGVYDYELVNVISKKKAEDLDSLETLEVIGVFQGDNGDEVELINLKHDMRFNTVINSKNVSHLAFSNYKHFKVGDRVKIDADYSGSYPVKIANIKQITKVANPDKQTCEFIQGQVWRPEGSSQIPTCVTVYSDAGKSCDSSSDCEGTCRVRDTIESATCASSSSEFGCGSSIEDFKRDGRILCID